MVDSANLDPRQPFGLDEAYSVQTPDDNRRLYAKWAATYESAFVENERYRYPKAIAELFNEVVPRLQSNQVVDIGTGTGLAGVYLAGLRPECIIHGVDISPEMLAQARQKTNQNGSPIYAELFERDLTKPVTTSGALYDALMSSGTFTHGHLGPGALSNLIPLVRKGGWCVIGINNEHFAAQGFAAKFRELVADHLINEPEIRIIEVYEASSVHYGDRARVALFTRK